MYTFHCNRDKKKKFSFFVFLSQEVNTWTKIKKKENETACLCCVESWERVTYSGKLIQWLKYVIFMKMFYLRTFSWGNFFSLFRSSVKCFHFFSFLSSFNSPPQQKSRMRKNESKKKKRFCGNGSILLN